MEDTLQTLTNLIQFSIEGMKKSGHDLVTYTEDSEADHGDGQQVGREQAYRAMINKCAGLLHDYTK
jgi:hypothetical protein